MKTIFVFLLGFTLLSAAKLCIGHDYNEEEESEILKHGGAANILIITQKNEFDAKSLVVDAIFDHAELKGRKVVAVSIVGIFRKGKSFLLNYFLRYLYGNFKSVNYKNNTLDNNSNWIADSDEPLVGFPWRAGVERETNGIVMWSDVFLYDSINGDKLAIVLIDIQGLFDHNTSPTVDSKLFALATLMSSVQIYNLQDVIQEDQLQYLQFTSDYAKLINNLKLDDEEGLNAANIQKPFQNILLLMRDWTHQAQFPFGLEGGKKYLNDVLHIKDTHKKDAREVRKFLNTSFENINCFLMPHPGDRMFKNPDFDGEWSSLDNVFVEQLKSLISWLFNPSNLVPKKIMGNFVTVEDYAAYVKSYLHAASSNALMDAPTVFGATMESEGNFMIQKSLNVLNENLKTHENFQDINLLEKLDEIIEDSKWMTTDYFKNQVEQSKKGSNSFRSKWFDKLKDEIEIKAKHWKETVTINFKKFQDVQQNNQKELDKKLEETKKEHDEKLQNMQSQFQAELNRIKQESEDRRRQHEMERIKIEKDREAEMQRMMQEKLDAIEEQEEYCRSLVANEKDTYTQQMSESRERENALRSEKLRLEQEQRARDLENLKKLKNNSKEHAKEVKRIKEDAKRREQEFREELEENERLAREEHEEKVAKLEAELKKVRNKLKEMEKRKKPRKPVVDDYYEEPPRGPFRYPDAERRARECRAKKRSG